MSIYDWGYFFMGMGVAVAAFLFIGWLGFLYFIAVKYPLTIVTGLIVYIVVFLNGFWFSLKVNSPSVELPPPPKPAVEVASAEWEEMILISALYDLKEHAIRERWLVFPEEEMQQTPAFQDQLLFNQS